MLTPRDSIDIWHPQIQNAGKYTGTKYVKNVGKADIFYSTV